MARGSRRPDEFSPHIDETIETIAELERRADESISHHQRRLEQITAAVGRPRVFYAICVFVLAWIVINGLIIGTGHAAFDPPPFSWLQGIITLSALLMTVLILTTENRTNQLDLQRNRLDLQINLLTERKISKVIEMLDALRRDSPNVPNRADPEARELLEASDPHAVVRELEERTPGDANPV